MMNEKAPPFSLPETSGGQVDSGSYRGRAVLLVFWTTSCGVCRSELPVLSRMAPEFRGKGVGVVAIHVGGDPGVADFIRSNHIAVTSLVDSDGSVGRAYQVTAVPKLVLVGSDGLIKRTSAGMPGESELRKWTESVAGS
jgi:peroxiredoxin